MPDRPGSIQSSSSEIRRRSLQPQVGLVAARDGLDLVAFGLEIVAQQQASAALRPRRSGCVRPSVSVAFDHLRHDPATRR